MNEHTNPTDPTRPLDGADGPSAGGTATDTEQERPLPPPPPPGPPRRLHRRTDQEVIGGVCAGLGDYFRIDPVVFRIGFVIAAFASGAGIIAYLIAWAIIPDQTGKSEVGGDTDPASSGETPPWVWVALAVAAVVVLGGFSLQRGPSLLIAAGLVALGVLLLRRDTAQQHGQGAAPSGSVPAAPEPAPAGSWGASGATPWGATTVVAPPPEAPPARPRTRDPIVRLALGLAVLAVGVMLALQMGTTIAFLPVAWTAVPLAIVGVGLVVGAVRGGARSLIGWGVVLLVALLLTIGATAFEPTGGDWAAAETVAPTSVEELADTYDLPTGELLIDLRGIPAEDLAGRSVEAQVGMGELTVRVDPDVPVTATARVGMGEVNMLGRGQTGGINLHRHVSDPEGADNPLVLDLRAGLGEVVVDRGR